MVAYVGIAPIVSAIAERRPPKSYLSLLEITRVMLVLVLLFGRQIWQVYLMIFAFEAFSAALNQHFKRSILIFWRVKQSMPKHSLSHD